MVSITNSNLFLGTKKPEDSTNESDNSGLENIFASMLSVIEEENDGIKKESEETVIGVADLLKKIKLEIGVSQETGMIKGSKLANTRLPSSNILYIYETYKTQIDQAIEIANDSVVSFDLELLLESDIALKKALTTNIQKDGSANGLRQNIENRTGDLLDFVSEDDSIKEFSKLEMARIKNTMKGGEGNNLEFASLDSKKNIGKNDSSSRSMQTVLDQAGSDLTKSKEKPLSAYEQNNLEIKPASQKTEGSKFDTLVEQNFSQSKSSAGKVNSSGLQSYSSQNGDQNHLKLLEKNWGKDLAKIIEKAIISGKDKIDISLEPQRLGKIQLTLTMLNNQTSIFISTDNPATSLILTNAEERLAQMFESAGYKLSNFQANSHGNNESGQKRNGSTNEKGSKNQSRQIEQPVLDESDNKGLLTIDGRKIINIIA